jgi:hypothetical protein
VQQQIWAKRREPSRAEAARVLAEVEGNAPSDPAARAAGAAAIVAKLPAGGDLAVVQGLAPEGSLEGLDALRKGRSRAAIEKLRPPPPAPTPTVEPPAAPTPTEEP